MDIRFDKIRKQFGNVVALDGVTLDIADGELFFLLGPSGCGKTTLLRCLGGFETPEEGRVLLGGQDITRTPPEKRNTAMVFQGYALWPHMTVAQNVSFGLEIKGDSRAERQRKVMAALETVQISELAERKPNELSGGQQQRVALARTLVVEPACLLLDEPLANLDAKLRRDMRSEIRRVCKESGLTALYVTHDRQEALSMADRMAVLKDGQVLQVGTPGEVYRHPLNSFVANFIGETNVISGTIREVDDKRLVADTPLGTIVSCNPHPPVAAGDTVLLSLRPETIRRKRQDEVRNTFQATCLQTTYLGELAEHVLGVRDEIHLKMFEINPRTRPEQGTCIDLAVDPEDVVVLNDGLNV